MIAVTGHTSGIGKEIYDTVNGCNGFSRSNGYDICNPSDRQKILSSEFDILINNAYDGIGQTLLLLDFFTRFQNTNKTIINVGSRIAEDFIVLPDDYQHLLTYQLYKKSLKSLSCDLYALNKSANIKYIWFGYVGTDVILAKYPGITDYITVDNAVMQILQLADDA
jgi:hypothetical protein